MLFFNELLSLIGLCYFLSNSFDKNLRLKIPRNTIYVGVLLFLAMCCIYALISLPLKTNWYYYFRNLSIIYSVFSFFIGYHLYFKQFDYLKKLRTKIYGYALIAFGLRWDGLIDRNAYSFWFAVLQKNWKITSVLILIFLYVLYMFAYTSLTVLIILIFVLGVLYLKSYFQFKFIAAIGIIFFSILLYLAIPYLKLYHHGSYNLFGDVEYVYIQHPFFKIDKNSSWRLIFWYRTVIETFPQNLAGVGVGTPLLPYKSGVTTTDLIFDDEYIAHVIGTHNTFITIFTRFGIASILILFFIYRAVFRDFFNHKKFYLNNRNDASLFLGFITLTAVGLFNLLIESPTLASLYWISLGFVARAIHERRSAASALSRLSSQ